MRYLLREDLTIRSQRVDALEDDSDDTKELVMRITCIPVRSPQTKHGKK